MPPHFYTNDRKDNMAIVTGTAYWASVTTPNTTFEPVYSVNLVVDNATAEKFQADGFTIKQMDEGPAIVIKRKVNGPNGMVRPAPKLLDKNKQPLDCAIGNGSSVTISTDHPITNFDTEIFVYEGPCSNLTCVGSDNNTGNGTTSEFTFTSNAGISYLIYVDGNGSSIGEFGISFTCQSCDADAGTWD